MLHPHQILLIIPLLQLTSLVPDGTGVDIPYRFLTTPLNPEELQAMMKNRVHRRRYASLRRKRTTPKYGLPDGTYYNPNFGKSPYDHDLLRNLYRRPYNKTSSEKSTTDNPYVPNNMPNFPFHLYETNPYLRDAQFNISYVPTGTYSTTENVFILYDDILLKKLHNHRARLFNNYDQHFSILFKRAWKHSVGAIFFDTCDSENHRIFSKTDLTRSESIYVFYEFLKKFRSCLKEVLSWHFQQIPDYSGQDIFTQEKSINDIRYLFYTIENFISYDSNDILEQFELDTRDNGTAREYTKHIQHVNMKLAEVIFPFVEKRYFNFLKKFKYPAAPDETILGRGQIGRFLYKLCYKVVREIRSEKFFNFPVKLPVKNYTREDLEIIRNYKKAALKEEKCETCEERRMIRNKKKHRI